MNPTLYRCVWLQIVFASLLTSAAADYRLRPAAGDYLRLSVEKTGLMSGRKHLFLFDRYEGRLHYDSQVPRNSEVQLSIESRSIKCLDTWLSVKDLEKVQQHTLAEMLAADRYETIVFRSNRIGSRESGRYEASGTLTIRDIAKPVTVRVAVDTSRSPNLVLEGEALIDMTEYGLKPPSAALGLIGTKKMMRFSFLVTAVPAK